MKSLILIITMLIFSTNAMAEDESTNSANQWVKVLGLTVDQLSNNSSINYFNQSSYRIDIFASTDARSKEFYAVKTNTDSDDALLPLSSMPQALTIKRGTYLNLVELASRESWERVVYETVEDCNALQVIKHVYFNGKLQTIVSNCGSAKGAPELSNNIKVLLKRLEAIAE